MTRHSERLREAKTRILERRKNIACLHSKSLVSVVYDDGYMTRRCDTCHAMYEVVYLPAFNEGSTK